MCLILLFTLLFSIYAWEYLFYVFCKIFSRFTEHLTINRCILTASRTPMCCYARGAKKEQKASSILDHGRTVVPVMNCGEPITGTSSSSFDCLVEIKRASL